MDDIDQIPSVACVVLNWNGWRDTVECLDSLKDCIYRNLVVIVVDNGSTDESVDKIRTTHPDVVLLESGANRGFSAGNNIGIRYALDHGAAYVWLLNNDTKPAPNALSALVSKALSDSSIGAVASICYYAERPDTVQIWAGGRVNLWIGYSPYTSEPHDDDWFDWLNGTSLLVQRAAFREVGLLDEKYFLYWEDTEFSLRLQKKRWRLAAAADSKVLHKVSATVGNNKSVLDRYTTASGLRTLKLYAPRPHLSMILFLGVRFTRRILRLQLVRSLGVCRGVLDHLRGEG